MKEGKDIDTDFYSVDFHYSFRSGLGPWEEHRFVKEHVLRIVLADDTGAEEQYMGEVRFLMVHLDHILESDHYAFDVLDAHSEYLARHILKVFDPDTFEYTNEVMQHYQEDLIHLKICFIENIQLLPKYRGYNIGAKAIKDIVFHHGSGCGLFMLQPFPLQFETPEKQKDYPQLELGKLEQDQELAGYKLMAYYQRIGFEPIQGVEGLVFHNPALKNEGMDGIDLEDNGMNKNSEHDTLGG